MADDLLTRPLQQTLDLLELDALDTVVLGATWTLVAPQQHLRFSITFLSQNFNDPIIFSPDPFGAGIIPAKMNTGLPVHVTMMEWGPLIQVAWYALCNGGQSVRVIQQVRRQ